MSVVLKSDLGSFLIRRTQTAFDEDVELYSCKLNLTERQRNVK